MATTGRDYSRLVQVAAIGTVAGMIWNQRSFQVDCQALALNAKWWHTLTLLGISFVDCSWNEFLFLQKFRLTMLVSGQAYRACTRNLSFL